MTAKQVLFESEAREKILRGAERLADAVGAELRAAGGYKVHDDLGRRMPAIEIDIDAGVDRKRLA